ncbi:MAG: NRDE family protein [Kistimonas sp.]|nr:NRDE family protein [Kistimonas sp.]
MCLIAFRWDPASEHPLIMGANRDEFYQRPAQKAHFWHDHPELFGGRDLQAGGTWLAISTRGRLAALTNYREPGSGGERSRGELVHHFLIGHMSAADYLQELESCQQLYAGFNLLLGDASGLWYFSNRAAHIRSLSPGVYGLCNGLLDTPWPKLVSLKKALHHTLDAGLSVPEDILPLLHDSACPEIDDLPDTGVGLEREKMLAPCFIRSSHYGTRNCLGLMIGAQGHVHWYEQYYGPQGQAEGQIRQQLSIAPVWPRGPELS